MAGARLRKIRRFSQIGCFAFFTVSILAAGTTWWPVREDLFFLFSPLITVVTAAAAGVTVPGVVLSLLMIALTLVFGRFFCGWMCPLGALIDVTEWLYRKKRKLLKQEGVADPERMSQVKFGILLFVLAASFASVQWIHFLDPMVIMTRTVGMALLPIRRPLMAGDPFTVQYSEQFLLFTAVILLLSVWASRFWCRFLCPLGAFFGLLGRFALFDFALDNCKGCPKCQKACPTGAIPTAKPEDFKPQECIRCFNCLDVGCATTSRSFGRRRKDAVRYTPVHMPRRTFLTWFLGGLTGAAYLTSSASGEPHKKIIMRPPFSADEDLFLDLCLRCQACVNVCPNNAIQPLFMESGLYGFWSPVLKPTAGYCEPLCNRCGQVCPTAAIGPFDIRSKYEVKMGTAYLMKARCIAHMDGRACGKCIPKCPTGAIAFMVDGTRNLPISIDYMLCVGCGVCENVCSHQTIGPPAMIVTAQGRNQVSGVNVESVIERLKKEKK